jgi:hypothetical protein
MIKSIILYIPRLIILYYKFLVQISKISSSSTININESKPTSWEFSVFSQNCEDGITNFLINKLNDSNKYFVEIGSSNGIENNTSYLAVVKKFSGLMIDGDKIASSFSKHFMNRFCIGVECLNLFVEDDTISYLKNKMTYNNPDVFSLDVDGNDYYLAKTILDSGIKPKIFIVEYNSSYGPDEKMFIKYQRGFNVFTAHSTHLYYGVSISAWKHLFSLYGYHFVTVDSNGVNAFFINKNCFEQNFLEKINGLDFKENFYQLKKFKTEWPAQFDLIKNENYNYL